MHTENTRFKLDPRTSLLLIIAVSAPTITAGVWYALSLAALIPISMYILSGKIPAAVKLAAVYALAIVTDTLLVDFFHGAVSIVVLMTSGIVCRLMPVVTVCTFVMSTTTVSEFIAAAEKMHVPRQIVIPFSVMLRFLPTIREESAAISDAMRMRGIAFGRTRGGPLALLEYRLIPMVISSVKIGDELSAAVLTRGLGAPIKRTNICKIGFHAQDIAYIAISCGLLLMYFILRTRGS